jgi:manganese/zinc/iron transport system permease protein
MTESQLEIQIIGALTAAACALPGVFLVLRRMAMLTDAISHAILLGIVLAFFVVENLNSPLLIVGAALAGLLTVSLVEALERTGRVREDAATGIVFPLLFGLGVILISRYAGNVHLDLDAVLLGELAYAPFNRLEIGGVDLGPQALWVMLALILLNGLLILLLYKELKLATFDPALAATLGLMPGLVHYLLMASVSVTTVGAFQTAGAILVVAFIVGPPATAYLLTNRLGTMLLLSMAIGAVAAVTGYWLAYLIDSSIAGAMAVMIGLLFLVALLLSPEQGVIAGIRRRGRQAREFTQTMLVIHLFQHEGRPEASRENRVSHLSEHLRWTPELAQRVVALAERNGLVRSEAGTLSLTDRGRSRAREGIAGT